MTTKNLLEKFLSKSNFISAYQRIASKKAAGGVDKVTVDTFGKRLDQHIGRLQKEIRERRYIPQPLKSIHIPKFNKENEWRELALPSVADKVVQAALLQVIEPLAEKIFSDCSYAYRPGKGHYKAIRRVDHILRNRKKSWIVHRDIHNFFSTLNHNYLIEQFSELVCGEPIMTGLVALWCRIGLVKRDGCWQDVRLGVPQGCIISPLLSNLYLHPLDKFVTAFGIDWVRYSDNYLILCNSQEEAVSSDILIEEFLRKSLYLRLNSSKTPPSHIDGGFAFLGVFFCGNKRAIDSNKAEKMKREIKWLLTKKTIETLEELISNLSEKAEGWKRYYGFLNPIEQFSKLDTLIEKEFIELATSRIKNGIWKTCQPEGLPFPSLVTEDNAVSIRKMKNVWKSILKGLKNNIHNNLNHSVEAKIAKRRRRYKREHGQNGYLVVTTPGYFIGKRGERIIVRSKQKLVEELPAIRLRGLTLHDRGISISGDVIELCRKKDINIHFVDNLGKIIAVITPPGGSSGETSLLQVIERDKEKGLKLARMFVLGKVKNQFALLKYYFKYPLNRENGFGKIFMSNKQYLKDLILKIEDTADFSDPEAFRQRLMGLEGAFGATYWMIVKCLFRNGIVFSGRERFGASDLVNSSLNYGYGVLYGQCLNAIIRAGLNPMAGFLHDYQSGKPTLVYDLIEEFRSFIVDRGIFSMLNRGEKLLQGEDNLLTYESRKKIAKSVIGRLSSEVWFRGHRFTFQEVIQEQANNIKKYLFNKIKYRPFLGRW